MKAYFLSDIHLNNQTDERAQKLLGLFRQWNSLNDITHLFLLGDIFDLWIADHNYFIQKYSKIIEQLQRLKVLGVEVHYFEGNHDLYLKHYFEAQLGFKVYEGPKYFHLQSQFVRVEHGDQMDPFDYGYRFLRWLLRTPIIKFLAPRLPQTFIVALGEKMSKTSRQYTSHLKSISKDRARDVIRKHAIKMVDIEKFDILICGHVHVVEDYSFNSTFGQSSRVINLGAWFDQAQVLIFDGQQWQIQTLG